MQDKTETTRTAAYRILAVEAILTAILSFLLFIGVDTVTAYSAALGGLGYVVPNAGFTRYVFRHSAAESPQRAARWFYIGEAVKVFTTVVIFAVCFLLIKPLNAASFFLTYVLMLIVNLRGLYIIMNR